MDLTIILWIIVGGGIFFALPPTVHFFMFWGVFHRKRPLYLDQDDTKGTPYYPYREEIKSNIEKAKSIPCEMVHITTRDGLKLSGRYYDSHASKTVICIHGFQSNAYNNFSLALVRFLERQYNVLLVDQRAHGKSKGHFTTGGVLEQYDLCQWVDMEAQKEQIESIYLYGISMGATTAGLASNKITVDKVKAIVMEAGFTSFADETAWNVRFVFSRNAILRAIKFYAKLFLKIDISTPAAASLAQTKIPVLFLHGDVDEAVPLSFTMTNYHACASQKELMVVSGAHHTLCWLVGGDEVGERIFRFIEDLDTHKRQ